MTSNLLDGRDKRLCPGNELTGSPLAHIGVSIVRDVAPKERPVQVLSQGSGIQLASVNQLGGKRCLQGGMAPGFSMKTGCCSRDHRGLKHRVITPTSTGVHQSQGQTVFRRVQRLLRFGKSHVAILRDALSSGLCRVHR